MKKRPVEFLYEMMQPIIAYIRGSVKFYDYSPTSIKRPLIKRPTSIKRPRSKVPIYLSVNCCI